MDSASDAGILIVDDDESMVRVLEIFLRGEGYTNVATTTKSRFALPLLAELGTDLLVLDLRMPHLSGFEIIDGLDSKIPTMMITGDVSPEVRQRALRSGVELVTKPFQVDEVLGWIKRMLEARPQNVGVPPLERGLIRVPGLPSDRRHEEAVAVSGPSP
jgi:putative two-component system response regulator